MHTIDHALSRMESCCLLASSIILLPDDAVCPPVVNGMPLQPSNAYRLYKGVGGAHGG